MQGMSRLSKVKYYRFVLIPGKPDGRNTAISIILTLCHNEIVSGIIGFLRTKPFKLMRPVETGKVYSKSSGDLPKRGFMNALTPNIVAPSSDSCRIEAHPWNTFTATRNRMASNCASSPTLLSKLAGRSDYSVQTRVAENDSTDSATLERLSLSDSSEVRAAVAQNEHTLRSTVLTLAEDLSSDVRYALAENAGTNMALLELLSLDENPYVQGRAIRTKARVLADEAYLTACGRA